MTQEILQQEQIVRESTKDLPALISTANGVKISNQLDFDKAFELTKEIKSRGKKLDELRKSLTKPLDETKKRIMDLFRDPIDSLSKAETIVKGAMVEYTDEQERIRLEQERKLREQAEREAEKQRQKLLDRAEKAEEKGKEEKAEELREQAEEVAPVDITLASTTQAPQGASFRMQYTAEVVDFTALPDTYKIPDIKALNAIVQAKKGEISIPGVKIVSKKIMSVR